MTEKRNVRADETRSSMRDEETRPETAWKPPALLDAPEPRPRVCPKVGCNLDSGERYARQRIQAYA
jgi:hypothetical protein